MRIKISELEQLITAKLKDINFSENEAEIVAKHLVDAELSGKNSHGIQRIKHFETKMQSEQFDPSSSEPSIEKETLNSLRINGYARSGIYVVEKFLPHAIKEAKSKGIYAVASNFGVNSGFIGCYARKAAENNLIYIGFHNSSGGLIPYGAIKDIWGTNPFTVGIPSNDTPIVLDFASTKITYGDVLKAAHRNESLPENSALDHNGNASIKPDDAWAGGLLAMGEHKGSGLGMIVELLAGVLSYARVGTATKGGWGSFYILINPEMFRPIEEFKDTVSKSIQELKSLPKAKGFNEIYFPGEQSQKLRKENIRKGEVEIDDDLYSILTKEINYTY